MSLNGCPWNVVRLGDHVDLLTGFPFKSQKFTDNKGDVPLVKGSNVHQGFTDWNDSKYWSRSDIDQYGRYFLDADDVILAMDRPWIEAGLKYSWIRKDCPKALLVQRVSRLRGTNGLHTQYLRYVIGSSAFTDYIKPIVTGINVPHISGDQIKSYRFPLPTLKIQKNVVRVLSAYDDLIENNTRRIAILESMAQALYQEWFVRFRFPGHEKHQFVTSPLGKVPEGWCKDLGEVVTLKRGYDLPQKERRYGTVPIVSSSGITDFHDEAKVRGPGVVTGRYGTLGEVFFVPNDFWPLNTSLYVQDFHGNEPILVAHLLRSLNLARQNAAGAVPGVNRNALHMLKVAFPPANLQTHISPTFKSLHEGTKNLEQKNENLRKSRNLLLPKLISGQIDVQHLDIDTGEALAVSGGTLS
jgi:type I restriction enzyme S subunit